MLLVVALVPIIYTRNGSMQGVGFDAAIDDYLHAIIRTRPWTKKREEELLTSLSDWLYAQPDLSVQLASVTPPVVRRYCATTGLDDAEQDDLQVTLIRLRVWAEINGYSSATEVTI
jgi:hypothetical protein